MTIAEAYETDPPFEVFGSPENWDGVQTISIETSAYCFGYGEHNVISVVQVADVVALAGIDVAAIPVHTAELRRDPNGHWVAVTTDFASLPSTWPQAFVSLHRHWR